MILSYTDYLKETEPLQIQGTVVEAAGGKGVEKVHIYVLEGTEEVLSNAKGEFKLSTWQKLPVTITVAHSNYVTETLKVSDASERLQIKLRKK